MRPSDSPPPPCDPVELEEHRQTKRTRLRWIIGISALLTLALLLALLAWPALNRHIEARNLAAANHLLAEQNYRDAWMLLEQAVQANPASLDARRARAQFYQAAAHRDTLAQWRQIAQESKREEDITAWAESARFHAAWSELEAALQAWPQPARLETARLRARLALACARDDRQALRELALSATAAGPEADYFLALARIGGPEDAAAQAELVRLYQNPTWRLRSALALLGRALAHSEAPQARRTVAATLLGPDADWPTLLRQLQDSTPQSATDALAWAHLLRGAGENTAAADWLARHATTWSADPTLASERANIAVALGRWAELHTLLQQGAWGPVPSAALDLAFAARLQHARGKYRHALLTWNDALDETARIPGAARALARLAALCAWPEAYEQALLASVAAFPSDAEAWRALATSAEAQGDAPKYAATLDKWLHSGAESPGILAEAAYAHLLGGGAWTGEWRDRAKRLAPPEATAIGLWLGEETPTEQYLTLIDQAKRLSPRGRLLLAVALTRQGRTETARPLWEDLAHYRFLPAEEKLRTPTRTP